MYTILHHMRFYWALIFFIASNTFLLEGAQDRSQLSTTCRQWVASPGTVVIACQLYSHNSATIWQRIFGINPHRILIGDAHGWVDQIHNTARLSFLDVDSHYPNRDTGADVLLKKFEYYAAHLATHKGRSYLKEISCSSADHHDPITNRQKFYERHGFSLDPKNANLVKMYRPGIWLKKQGFSLSFANLVWITQHAGQLHDVSNRAPSLHSLPFGQIDF